MSTPRTCYWPDRVAAQSDLVPCNATASTSNCCYRGESCLESGLCYSKVGVVYRGACTDPNWKDCFSYANCNSVTSTYEAWLTTCTFNNTSPKWACYPAFASNSDPCSGQQFNLQIGNVQYWNITGLAATSSSSPQSATPSSSSTQVPSTTEAASSSNAVAVGAGVGVPLGVLLLLAIAGMLWYRHKWLSDRRVARPIMSSEQPVSESMVPRYEPKFAHDPAEMGPGRPAELRA